MDTREHLLNHVGVVASGGTGVEVIGDSESGQVLGKHPVVLVRQLLGGDAGFISRDQNRSAVFIGS